MRLSTGLVGVLCAGLLGAGPSAGQEPPPADYYVYVAAESEDEVAVIRFGPSGTEVVETIPVGLFPTETDGPHGIAVDPVACLP